MISLNMVKLSALLVFGFFQPQFCLAKASSNMSIGKPLRLHDIDEAQTMDMDNGCEGEFLLEEGQNKRAKLKIFIGGGRLMFSPENSRFSRIFSDVNLRKFGEMKKSIHIGGYKLSLNKDVRRIMDYDSYPVILTVSKGVRITKFSGYWIFACD